MICGITGNRPVIRIHDGFKGTASWAGFFYNSDHIILDTHLYFAFAPNDSLSATSRDPLDAGGILPKQAYSSRESSLKTRCVCGFAF
jgi:hypothetical protein